MYKILNAACAICFLCLAISAFADGNIDRGLVAIGVSQLFIINNRLGNVEIGEEDR